MVRKRKSTAVATTTASPSSAKPAKQLKKQPVVEQPPVEQPVTAVEEEEEEYEEVEEEIEEEYEEEYEEEIEEENEEIGIEKEEENDDDEDPISSLIDPFTKEQLIAIVCEAAEKHADVAASVRNLADQDITHRKIFVYGLGWDTTTETLISAFKGYGEIVDCKSVTDKVTGKSKGYGFILFKTRAGARKALREPQKTISGRTAYCQLAALGPVSNSGGSGGGGLNSGGSGYQSEHTQRKIYVSNVSEKLNVAKLKEFFAKYGEIEEGPLGVDKATGKFKGFCLFVYKTVEGAKKALKEPHKMYEGHTLHCQRAIDGPKHGKSGGNGHGKGGGGLGRVENSGLVGPVAGPLENGVGLMGQSYNPALGQALTALLVSQGGGLGLNNLLGTIGAGGVHMGQSGGYETSGIMASPVVGGGLQSVYPRQQLGRGGGVSVRSKYGYNGTRYGRR